MFLMSEVLLYIPNSKPRPFRRRARQLPRWDCRPPKSRYRGTSPIRNSALLAPYSRTILGPYRRTILGPYSRTTEGRRAAAEGGLGAFARPIVKPRSANSKVFFSSSFLLSSLEKSDAKVYQPEIRALLGTTLQLCAVFFFNRELDSDWRQSSLEIRERLVTLLFAIGHVTGEKMCNLHRVVLDGALFEGQCRY